MPDSQHQSFEFWKSYYAFRLANWVRSLVGTLCSPLGTSGQFPKMQETRVDSDFREFCRRDWRERILGVEPQDEVPPFMKSAEDEVLNAMVGCDGKLVENLLPPMQEVCENVIPPFQKAIDQNVPAMQEKFGKPASEIKKMVSSRIRNGDPQVARSIVNQIFNILQGEGALPDCATDEVNSPEPGLPAPVTAAVHGDLPQPDDAPAKSSAGNAPRNKQPAATRAAGSYEWVCAAMPDLMPKLPTKYTKEQWLYIRNNECPAYLDDQGNEIEVPAFETWKRQVRAGQADPSNPKASPRGGREHGKSIVRANQIESARTSADS